MSTSNVDNGMDDDGVGVSAVIGSVAMVFRKNEVIVLSKFVKIVGILDKIDNLENRGVI
jgi:hypothetical protein